MTKDKSELKQVNMRLDEETIEGLETIRIQYKLKTTVAAVKRAVTIAKSLIHTHERHAETIEELMSGKKDVSKRLNTPDKARVIDGIPHRVTVETPIDSDTIEPSEPIVDTDFDFG